MLYEIAFLKKPTKAEEEKGIGEQLLWGPQAVTAETEEAAIAIAGGLAEKAGIPLSSNLIQVVVRGFHTRTAPE